MQSLDKPVNNNELRELKNELTTAVQALGILHDFIENVFGSKFKSFCDHQQNSSPTRGQSNPREALRELRWKHINNINSESADVKASNEFKRSSNDEENEQLSNSRVSMICQPEVVDVKLEAACGEEILPDFFEDVDPFDEQSGYSYEGDSIGAISSSFDIQNTQLQSQPQTSTENSGITITKQNSSESQSPQQNRYIPGLIPIQSDPLKQEELGSDSVSSDCSDGDWHPISSSTSNKTNKEQSANKKKKQVQQKITTSITSKRGQSLLIGKTSIQPIPSPIMDINQQGDGGPFKCTMCPASYKQEESLKSHQKYKHNPSRVQCQCPLCGKSMVDKYRLQRHLRLHTGEKPFECQFCGQSFYRKDYHTKHMQRKHGLNSANANYSPSSSTSSNSSASATTAGKPPRKFPPTTSAPMPVSRNANTNARTSTSPRTTTNHQVPNVNPLQVSAPPTQATQPTSNSNFMDYFTNIGSAGLGEGESSVNSSGINSMITMTSLTFDDLISADL